MVTRVTATIVFTLHEDIEAMNLDEEQIEHSIADCLENERDGVAQYQSANVTVTFVEEVGEE